MSDDRKTVEILAAIFVEVVKPEDASADEISERVAERCDASRADIDQAVRAWNTRYEELRPQVVGALDAMLEDHPGVTALTPEMSGRWLVTTQGSAHVWDLDAMTWERRPGPGGCDRLI